MNLSPLSKINKDIKELKRQINGPEKKADNLIFRTLYFWNPGEYVPKTLKEELEAQDKRIDEIGKSFKNLLTHLKLEPYKITEENGMTKVTEGYRVVKKKLGRPAKEQNHCDCQD